MDRSVLVLVTDYPRKNGRVSHQFVHVRNLFYKKNGIKVTVLNFSSKTDYIFEGINIISERTYAKIKDKEKFEILISHQPNIRKHYKFLKIYGSKFERFMFFFHGHEVLKINKVYPKPYDFINRNLIKEKFQDIYDWFKLKIWEEFFPGVINKSDFIFVSEWMLKEFLRWTKIPSEIILGKSHIINNGVAEPFEKNDYSFDFEKEYDFVTIRNNLDGSKYCIDIVNNLAKNNLKLQFLVVGKGSFFNFFKKSSNITWINDTFNHKQIIEVLQKSKCGLMPTRTDAQGLMMCEMATFGLPIITSDIDVCHEMLDDFKNVKFIDNEEYNKNGEFKRIYNDLIEDYEFEKNEKFYNKNTISKEVEIIKHKN